MTVTGPITNPGVLPLAPSGTASPATPAVENQSGVDFATELGRAVGEAGRAERASDEASAKFAAGDPSVGLHEVMIASEKASIGVRYAVTLQKKLVDAYREIMQTNI